MSITKLKTVGDWQPVRWQDVATVAGRGSIRGRVITGMLTGGDAASDELASAQERVERAR
jgi:hypothetical protein